LDKDLYFEYIEDFANYIIGRVEDDEELFVTVVGKFGTIKPLLKEVMAYEFVDFESIEIESVNIDNYADEFVLSFWMNDGVVEIGCERLKRAGDYMSLCVGETYLLEDCSSKIIPLCDDSNLYFVNFDEEFDCDDECCGCCECNKEDDDIYGFTVDNETDNGYSKFTYYSSSPVDKTDIRNILRELGF
jgi:hypothetical protein